MNTARLEKIMRELRIKDPGLAELLEVNKTSVGRWRKGEQVPSGESFYYLCALFGHSPAYFLGHDGEVREYVLSVVYNELGKEAGEAFEKILALIPEKPALPGRQVRAEISSGLLQKRLQLEELRRRASDRVQRRSRSQEAHEEKPASDD